MEATRWAIFIAGAILMLVGLFWWAPWPFIAGVCCWGVSEWRP